MNVDQAKIFEDEVRRIARILWPSPRFQGAQIIESRERDGYFETDDAIHVVEATTDRRKAKAEDDCKKTAQLVSELRKTHKDKVVKGWLVLRHEPTADQNAVAKQYERTVTVVPYSKFLSRIIDAPGYLNARANCPFGSATDPFDNNHSVPRNTFVDPYLANTSTSKDIDFHDFCALSAVQGGRTILLGDFGAGKSMSLREFYFQQADQYLDGTTSRFPVYLNLRAHQGQEEPIEALIRHAKFVGYKPGEDLIKAWRADLTTIILDGFDELVTPAWTRELDQLKSHRAACVALVGNFLRESPRHTPVIVSGRTSYFNSTDEMRRTFRIMGEHNTLSINDFTPSQVMSFLAKLKAQYPIPPWVPPRPLLLGYMAAYQRKHGQGSEHAAVDPATGWNELIDRFCERETDLTKGLYKESIRSVLDRIATKARNNSDITSPIKSQDISTAFSEIFDRLPDGDSLGMLLRLPGLISTESASDERRFVDSDIANVSAAGDILRYVLSPHTFDKSCIQSCISNISDLGADFILMKLAELNQPHQLAALALEIVASDERFICLSGDLMKVLARSEATQYSKPISVKHSIIDEIDLTSPSGVFQSITLTNCNIGRLLIDPATLDSLPIFEQCHIDQVDGVHSESELAMNFSDCVYGNFTVDQFTSNKYMDLEIAPGIRVFLTVLRKLYLQGGGGRQENAFSRGIPHKYKSKVSPVLEAACSYGFAERSGRPGNVVYLKNPARKTQVFEILNKKGNVKLGVISEVSKL